MVWVVVTVPEVGSVVAWPVYSSAPVLVYVIPLLVTVRVQVHVEAAEAAEERAKTRENFMLGETRKESEKLLGGVQVLAQWKMGVCTHIYRQGAGGTQDRHSAMVEHKCVVSGNPLPPWSRIGLVGIGFFTSQFRLLDIDTYLGTAIVVQRCAC